MQMPPSFILIGTNFNFKCLILEITLFFPKAPACFPDPCLPKCKATTVHNVPLGQLTKNTIYRTLCFAQSFSVSSLCEDKNRKKDILNWSLHLHIHFPVSVSAPLWRILSGWELSHDAVTFPWKNHRAFSHFELFNFIVILVHTLWYKACLSFPLFYQSSLCGSIMPVKLFKHFSALCLTFFSTDCIPLHPQKAFIKCLPAQSDTFPSWCVHSRLSVTHLPSTVETVRVSLPRSCTLPPHGGK